MYNVMIVDDAAEIRTGLKLKLNWERYGFHIKLEASNGAHALSLLEEEPVQLLITDIRMPVLDGLKLIQECSERFPSMKTVVLSGYDDFPYVQTALRHGVKDYLLKPVLKDELTSLLLKVKKELDGDRERALLMLVREEEPPWEVFEYAAMFGWSESELSRGSFRFVTVEMRVPPWRLEADPFRPDLFRLAFQLLTQEIAEQWAGNIVSFHDPGRQNMMHFLIRLDREAESQESGGITNRFTQQLRRQLNELLHIESVIGVGKPVTGFKQWTSGFDSCLTTWSRSNLDIVSQIVFDDSDIVMNEISSTIQKKLTIAFENANEDQLLKLIEEVQALLKQITVQSFSYLMMHMYLTLNAVVKKYEIKDAEINDFIWKSIHSAWEYKTPEENLHHMKCISRQILSLLKEANQVSGQEVVASIQKYIQKHYAEELSLSSIAKQYHYNVAYLSDLVKKQTGLTFSEHLLNARMEQASRLLLQSDLKLTDIAELTGFSSPHYFSNVFKSFYGISPNEYRKK